MSFGRVAAARPNSEFGCCDNQPACAMPHASTLIATIVVGIGLAFILGTIANRLLADYDLESVWVKAAKPEPPIALSVDEVSVEVWREANAP